MSIRALRSTFLALAIVLVAQLALASSALAAGRYIVVLRDGASPAAAAKRHGAAPDYVYGQVLRGYAATLSASALARVKADPAVAFVTPDRVVAVGKPGGGTSTTAAQFTPTGVRRIGIADQSIRADRNPANDGLVADIDVAVIDSGIDLDHPDLNASHGANCSSGTTSDDGNGHGTHVAGTIGAIDNAWGVVGVAPGVHVVAYRVLNNAGSGTISGVICGINAAAANTDIEVANLSLGGGGTVPAGATCATTGDAFHLALCNLRDQGVNVVVAAGNDDVDASTTTPAGYAELFTVSAWADFNGSQDVGTEGKACRTDVDETLADFSNWGDVVDLAAPGVCIRSTWKGGGYSTISGTSMAAPHVAGAAALWRATHDGARGADATANAAVRDATEDQILATRELRGASDDPDTEDEGILDLRAW